uniref:Uncharacterized protein n=1 Tax=Crocodylus porosus TaxID=8502 RepID=A0A7M4F589_CROPO
GASVLTCMFLVYVQFLVCSVVPGLTYRCMDLNLSRVPTEIPSSTQNLDLSFNPLGSLGSNNFAAVPALKFLDLAR